MIKMYLEQEYKGSEAEYWEKNWENDQFESAVKFCAIDPIRPLFEKYSKTGDLLLEGGCGMGQYVTYYSEKGRRVVGLDFAQKTLKKLRSRGKGLNLVGGDVAKLPFADETFDVYYSGGVVEHFEAGAEESLSEARRVLKQSGTLLISVPYYSPLRKLLMPVKSLEWRRVEKPEVDESAIFPGKKFFQYAYEVSEFEKMLADAKLRVIEKQGYSVLWGIYDIPYLDRSNGNSTASGESKPNQSNNSTSFLKRLVVSEDDTIPILGHGVKLSRYLAANLMMYVCVRQ